MFVTYWCSLWPWHLLTMIASMLPSFACLYLLYTYQVCLDLNSYICIWPNLLSTSIKVAKFTVSYWFYCFVSKTVTANCTVITIDSLQSQLFPLHMLDSHTSTQARTQNTSFIIRQPLWILNIFYLVSSFHLPFCFVFFNLLSSMCFAFILFSFPWRAICPQKQPPPHTQPSEPSFQPSSFTIICTFCVELTSQTTNNILWYHSYNMLLLV